MFFTQAREREKNYEQHSSYFILISGRKEKKQKEQLLKRNLQTIKMINATQ